MAYDTVTPRVREFESDGTVRLVCSLTGAGVDPVTRDARITDGVTLISLKAQLAGMLAGLNSIQSVTASVPLNAPLDVTPPPPKPPVPPTQDELDRATFVAAYRLHVGMQKAVADGIKQAGDADVVAAAVAMKAAFKPGYETLLAISG